MGNSQLLISLRFWINSSFICASCTPWIIITRASTPTRTRCPTAVASSMSGGPCRPTASVMEKVSSQLSHCSFPSLSAASGLSSALAAMLCRPLLSWAPPGSLLQPALRLFHNHSAGMAEDVRGEADSAAERAGISFRGRGPEDGSQRP